MKERLLDCQLGRLPEQEINLVMTFRDGEAAQSQTRTGPVWPVRIVDKRPD
jgi:hypothetical protein